jgi:hypothetical protein
MTKAICFKKTIGLGKHEKGPSEPLTVEPTLRGWSFPSFLSILLLHLTKLALGNYDLIRIGELSQARRLANSELAC